MGIRFDDNSVDASGVRDRRGAGGRAAIGGGGVGILGLVIYLIVSVLGGGGGVDPSLIVPADGSVQSETGAGDLQTRCNTEGAIDRYDDCFLVKVYNEIDEVWAAHFPATGGRYGRPALTFFTSAVSTDGCGRASSQVGPFYCPADRSIYLDIGFLAALQREFGAEGRYAQAYILAHEYGHHLQTLLGTENRMRKAQRSDPSRENALSVAFELQADCYAGVWSRLADDAGNVSVGEAEVREAQAAAAAVGDDRIQKKSGGRVDAESWTHGSAVQREKWFTAGRTAANLDACDTFTTT